MNNFSYFTKLRNSQHASYAMEFLNGMPRGVYDNKRPNLTELISKEIENLKNVRRNTTRVKFNRKCKELRSLLAALRIILYNEQRRDADGGVNEYHSFVIKILGQKSNIALVSDVRSFLASWSGVTIPSADSLITDIRNLTDEIDTLNEFKEMEDFLISTIKPQSPLRAATDYFIENIIKKAEVEKAELSPSIESEKERLEIITEFLSFINNWITRIKLSVKNYSKDEPTPPEDEDITPLSDDDDKAGNQGGSIGGNTQI